MIGIAGEGLFNDARLDKRFDQLLGAMLVKEQVCISALSQGWASQMAYYRLLANEKVSQEKIISALYDYTRQASGREHYLLLQDTTQPNFEKHRGHIKPGTGLGVIGNKRDLGFFLHLGLVLQADTLACLGFAHVRCWSRDPQAPDRLERGYKSLPIEEKESCRWLQGLLQADELLAQARLVTCICDREGDIFDLFAHCSPKRHLLVRSRDNRRLAGPASEQGLLYELLARQCCAGVYELELRGDIRHKRHKRKALIQVRFTPASIAPPARLQRRYAPCLVWCVEAREQDPPPGEKAVHWRLLTTHRVESFEEAVEIIYWYSQRWYMETLFRLLKNKGMRIEECRLEEGKAIIKMVLLALVTALRIMLLLLAGKGEKSQHAGTVFSQEELHYLRHVEPHYQGSTLKQQNPYPRMSLAWVAWLIARIGGWKGLQSQGGFGVITLAKGLREFNSMFKGYRYAKDMYKT